jgi:hypothetical protein
MDGGSFTWGELELELELDGARLLSLLSLETPAPDDEEEDSPALLLGSGDLPAAVPFLLVTFAAFREGFFLRLFAMVTVSVCYASKYREIMVANDTFNMSLVAVAVLLYDVVSWTDNRTV